MILVTMLTEAIFISEAFRAGASGYVLKQSASEELRGAIDSVLANERFLSRRSTPKCGRRWNTSGSGPRALPAISPTANERF